MQSPPRPGPGKWGRKPNGLDDAASMTSQAEIPMRWHISASSLASPMFTARKVFSCSFAVSATIVLDSCTTVSTIGW